MTLENVGQEYEEITQVCGFKDKKGKYHDSYEKAVESNLYEEVKSLIGSQWIKEHYPENYGFMVHGPWGMYGMSREEVIERIIANYHLVPKVD